MRAQTFWSQKDTVKKNAIISYTDVKFGSEKKYFCSEIVS